MVQNQKKINIRQSQPDTLELVKKYLDIIWRKKVWILLIFLGVSAFWIVFYSMFLGTSTIYSAHAIIKFDDPRYNRGTDAVTDFAETQTEAKVALLQTRSFLERVVDSLKLNIVGQKPLMFTEIHFLKNFILVKMPDTVITNYLPEIMR